MLWCWASRWLGSRYQSHQLVKTLGLMPVRSDGDKDTLIPLAQGWATFKAVVENGTIIWTASPAPSLKPNG